MFEQKTVFGIFVLKVFVFVWKSALRYIRGDKYRECNKLIQLPGKLFLLYALLLCQENDVYSKHFPCFLLLFTFCWCLFGFIFWSIYLVFEGVNIVIGIVFLAGWFILKSILCLNDISAVHQKINPIPDKLFPLATLLLCQEIDVKSKHFCPFSFASHVCLFSSLIFR